MERTSGVRAVGEKTAREPFWSLTGGRLERVVGRRGAVSGTYGASSADLDLAESQEGRGTGYDVGCDMADDHHLGWLVGDEFLGHGGDDWENKGVMLIGIGR